MVRVVNHSGFNNTGINQATQNELLSSLNAVVSDYEQSEAVASSTQSIVSVDSFVGSPVQTFICLIADLTDASSKCKRHVINLSGSYTVEHLIREAANFYSYDPFTFSLMWKCGNNEMINLSNIYESSLSLADLGLNALTKNVFEIHEKEGPPKRIKIDDFSNSPSELNTKMTCNDSDIDNLPILEPIHYPSLNETIGTYPIRRNATTSLDAAQQSNLISSTSSVSSFFNYDDDSNTGYVGLINQAMTCYLNSLLQTLYMTPEFRNAIYRWKYNEAKIDDEDGKKSIPFQLQRLFLNLQTSNKKSIHTHDLTKSFGWNSDDAFQQHDVQELSRVMFDALEKTFKGTEQQNLINELYQGKIKDYVKCDECNTESARVDVFLDISLCIRPFGSEKTYESVEAALDAFIQSEILDENNKYLCAKCNRKCKAHKGLKFVSFPYILSLQLKRFDFDYSTMSRLKLSNTVTFPEILNVKKYLYVDEQENNNYIINNNDKSVDKQEEIEEKITKKFQNSKTLNEEKKEEETYPNQDLAEPIDKILKLDEYLLGQNASSVDTEDSYDYELFSIMIHSGSATGGHYYAYIKCFETDQWYNFNDERITKLDRQDISKAFGTSFSLYSSTTAYMLFYRQKNTKRNEHFIKAEQFSEHLKQSLDKEKKQQMEADLLKEYMENVCKIKVLVPNVNEFSENKNEQTLRKREKTVNIHKDLTMDQAKLEIIKEFDLSNYLTKTKKKCRLLKYDVYNDLIEHSYKNETSLSVFEAVGFTKYPYNLCWYLEILSEDLQFVEFNSSDFKLKIINLCINTLEVNELFNLRLPDNSTVFDLNNQIAQKLNCQLETIRMALEKPNSMYNYIYLSKNLSDTLRSLHFSKVSKVFIEYEDKQDALVEFERSKFYYALDTITNLIQMTVYLPNEEQCDLFKKKTTRHLSYLQLLRERKNEEREKAAIVAGSESSSFIHLSPIGNYQEDEAKISNETNNQCLLEQLITSNNIDTEMKCHSNLIDENDEKSSSSASSSSYIQSNSTNNQNAYIHTLATRSLDQTNYDDEFDINLVENHFDKSNEKLSKQIEPPTELIELFSNRKNLNNEMETSLDEGIGSSGSLSTTTTVSFTNNKSSSMRQASIKSSPNCMENLVEKNVIIENGYELLDYKKEQQEKDCARAVNKAYCNYDEESVGEEYEANNVGHNTTDENDNVSSNNEETPEENETHLGDVADRCDADFADLDADVNENDIEINVYDDNALNEDFEYNVFGDRNALLDTEYLLSNNSNSNTTATTNTTTTTTLTSQLPLSNTQTCDKQKQRVKFSDIMNGNEEFKLDFIHSIKKTPESDSNQSYASNLNVDVDNENEAKEKNNLNEENTAIPESLGSIFSMPTNLLSSKLNKVYDSSNNEGDISVKETELISDKDNYHAYSRSNSVEKRMLHIKSNLIVDNHLGTRTLETRMDKRIDLNEFKTHIDLYLKLQIDNFRVFRMCQNDLECELTVYDNQFTYLTPNTKFLIKLGPPLKYGEYVTPIYKLNKIKGTFSYLCDLMILHGLSVINHKEMLIEDLKEECNLDIPIDRLRLRKKNSKRPGNILLDNLVFGSDLFVNSSSEFCIEILDEPEKKLSYKFQTSVYLRHWKPDQYELGELEEVILDGNTFEILLNRISLLSEISLDDLQVFKCKRDFPFKSPILDLHREAGWRDNSYLKMEKLEDGVCFYYRNKTLKLGTLSDEKRRELVKEDNLNFRPISYSFSNKKETGIKIQVENN